MRLQQKRPSNVDQTRWIIDFMRGEDCFIVGGGPSLYGFDFSRLDGKRVIVVNHSYMYVKNFDVLVFLDNKFREHFIDRGHNFDDIPRIIAGPCSGMEPGGNVTKIYYAAKPTRDPCTMYGNTSSTLVAINAALIMGAARIFLMGIDCRFNEHGGHFYSHEWAHESDKHLDKYQRQILKYNEFQPYKNIYNLSTISVLSCFKKLDIDSVL